MKTVDQCCRNTESQFSMRILFNYCFLLFLALAIGSWCIQSASAQQPSGTLQLVGPSPDPSPGDDIEIEIKILNPQHVSVFTIEIEYPTVFDYEDFEPGTDQFNKNNLSLGSETHLVGGRTKRQFVLGINYDMGEPVFVSEGTLFTITFQTEATVDIGNYQVKIVGTPHLQDAGSNILDLDADNIPSLNVPIRGPMQGTVGLVPLDTPRAGETSFVDIELTDRSRAHKYEITVDPSTNLGPLTVSYNADDTNGTAIINHTAGDPITISADLWLPNDPIDNVIDWRVTHSDPIVVTLFFTPTATGEGSLEITAAKIFDADDTALTLSNPDPLTFTIASSESQNIVHRNTGVGPKPIIEVEEGTKEGPFEIKITFQSKNYIEKQLLRVEDGKVVATFLFQRGVYGFGRDEIEVGGTAGASVTTRLWEADGAGVYYARINPTVTGAREVTIQIPAGVVREVGTNLLNVASKTVTVSTNLEYPPWDVDENGMVEENDAELVEAALGQGMEDKHGIWWYVNTIENRRTDVNGDLYVNQVDVDLVRAHISDDGAEGSGDVSGQSDEPGQARSTAPEPEPSVWMPDANLRRVIRKALGVNPGEHYTQAQVATLTKLTATKSKIKDLTGLEYATHLRKLDLRTNRINDIGVLEGLTELTDLKIGENNISDITALAGLTQLTHVGLAENKISDITALENLTNLTELWLRANNINDITALGNLTKLKELWLEDNKISDITALENLTHLRKLDLRTNRINDISPLEDLTELTELKMGTNNIRDITALAGLTQLTDIGLAHNKISDITALENLTNLIVLWLRANNINDITTLENLTKLKELNLQDNEISDITALENLTKLTYLNLSGNEIRDVTALENLTNLTELWMADNDISDISPLSNMVKLRVLRIGGNPILDLSPLYPLIQGKLKWYGGLDIPQYPPWDVNEDGSVDATDSALVTAALGQSGNGIVDDRTDVNGDGTVDQDDLTLVTNNLDTDGGAPSTSDLLTLLDRKTLETLDRETLKTYLNTLRAESDGSPKYLRAIAMIENLLATTRPKQTLLLANYPNPFNPETWIPYQLANASDVKIIIYDTHGPVVRRLDLGHQPEGYYTTRSRAAYWDGRNTFGERVANGIYFYQLQAGNISSLRKLLILK